MSIRPIRYIFGRSTSYGDSLWPVLALLAAVVLIPSASLLWFMTRAMQNERLAVRQRLSDAYASQLLNARENLERYWNEKAAQLDRCTFAKCIISGIADSLVLYDGRGRPLYPSPSQPPASTPSGRDPAWNRALALERSPAGLIQAADAYGAIATSAADPNVAARALQAQARCLGRSGQVEAAIRLITGKLAEGRFRHATDLQGRLLVADAELMALQLMGSPEQEAFRKTAARLHARLTDYEDPALGAAQRLFLMKRFQALPLPPGDWSLPTLAAEELAARFLEKTAKPSSAPGLRISSLPGVWQFASASGRVTALFRAEALPERMKEVLAPPAGASITIEPPGPETEAFQVIPAGNSLPGWRIVLRLTDRRFFDDAAERQVTIYLWTGIVGLAAVSILAGAFVRKVRRQARLAQLRNDLVSTVSHELKTPLSSMRLLIDTLVDEPHLDERKAREYLGLVSRENSRLSRLIENFLAFSRMEQNRQTFERRETAAAQVVSGAVDAIRERFQAGGCRLDVDVGPDLPPILADPDALTTVLINLLDNAWKYSGEDRQIRLRAYSENGSVCFDVSDNGIGLSPRQARKVFEPFYQADERLSRKAGGCGLGLSIVRFIVSAHGGDVRVSSRPGEGSTFTVSVPASREGVSI